MRIDGKDVHLQIPAGKLKESKGIFTYNGQKYNAYTLSPVIDTAEGQKKRFGGN